MSRQDQLLIEANRILQVLTESTLVKTQEREAFGVHCSEEASVTSYRNLLERCPSLSDEVLDHIENSLSLAEAYAQTLETDDDNEEAA